MVEKRIEKGESVADQSQSVYTIAGGEAGFRRLVDLFYQKVAADPVLRPMFPDDLEPGKHWQLLFLTQFFGGPALYAEERGHPRLRQRHFPFPINQQARDHWLSHMLAAIDEAGIPEPARGEMRAYFERASVMMINAEVEPENLMRWQPPKQP